MSILATCQCGKSFNAKPDLAGKTVKCPACGSALSIPKPEPKPAADGIRVSCTCGRAFNAPPALAGKKAKCPGCGSVLSIPAIGGGLEPLSNVADPLASDPLGSNDPFGLGGMDDRAFASAPASSLPSSSPLGQPATAPTAPRGRAKTSGSGNRGLVIGLAVGGVVLGGVLVIVVLATLLIPAVKAAREAAQKVKARHDARAAQVGASATSTNTSADNWITYTWPPDRYSILMPRQPRRQTQFHSGVRVSMASCDMGPSGAYFVATSRAPVIATVQGFDAEAALEGAVNGAVAKAGGQLISKKTIQLDDCPGREISFSGTHAGKSFTAHARLYVVGNTIYQTMFLGPSGNHPGADLNRFFDSFKLTGPPLAKQNKPKIGDGVPPTIPPVTSPPAATPPATMEPTATTPAQSKAARRLAEQQRKNIYRSLIRTEGMINNLLKQAETHEQAGRDQLVKSVRDSAERLRQTNLENHMRIYSMTIEQLKAIRAEGDAGNWK